MGLCYMLCYVMLCYVMLCYVMLCYAMLCYVMLCYQSHMTGKIISKYRAIACGGNKATRGRAAKQQRKQT
jgi:hypothetical protein